MLPRRSNWNMLRGVRVSLVAYREGSCRYWSDHGTFVRTGWVWPGGEMNWESGDEPQ